MKKLGLMALALLLAGCGHNAENLAVKVLEVNENGETVEKVIEVTQEEAEKIAKMDEENGVLSEETTTQESESALNETEVVKSDSGLKTNAILRETGVKPIDTDL